MDYTKSGEISFLFWWIMNNFPQVLFYLFSSFLDASSVTFKSVPLYLYSILGYAIYICTHDVPDILLVYTVFQTTWHTLPKLALTWM